MLLFVISLMFLNNFKIGYRCPGDDDDTHQCNAGQYSSSGQSSCSTCGAGTYSSAGASQCTTCVDGKISSAGASSCTLCPNGKNKVRNFYQNKLFMKKHNNHYSDLNHQNCLDCYAGYYGLSGLCYQCPPGKYQNNQGQTSCILCAPGSNSSSNGNAVCSQCNQDYYAPSSGAIDCTPCSFGMFSDVGASSCNSVCGDGKKASDEECDDNNSTDGDGCDGLCKIEPGYYCKETPSTSPSFCYTICGDSKRAGTEKCDDGNLNNLDGCSSSCIVETYFECLGGTPTTIDVCQDICGDGVVAKRTMNSCDDGNLKSGDGCSNLCVVDYGWDCSGGNTLLPDYCSTLCGDGILVTPYEQCDDGNRASGDGCSVFCIIEENCYCTTNLSAPINSICSEYCGDGKNMYILPCDDGNTKNDDGCSSSCVVETGFKCEGGSPTKRDTCTEICGDGIDLGHNECEDGNLNNGDGCSSTCEFESCYECKGGNSTSVDVCSELHIIPSVKTISASNTIEIEFSHEMNKTDITLNDLSISIPYDYTIIFDWRAYYSNNKTLTINFNVYTVLTGKEQIKIKFINYKVWRGPFGGCLTKDQLPVNAQNSLASSVEAANSISKATEYSTYFGIIVTSTLVLIGGGSLEMIWALINTLQLISYLPLMTTYFPEPVKVMFQVLKFSNMNFEFLSDAFYKITSLNAISAAQYSDLFTENEIEIETPLFLINCASVLMTLICNILLFSLLLFLNKIICCK